MSALPTCPEDLAESFVDEVTEKLGIPRGFDERKLRQLVLGEAVVDALVADFVRRHPAGLVLSINPGLSTRFSRIDNGRVHAIDFDTKDVCDLKRAVFPRSERYVLASACKVGCTGFLRHLGHAANVPVLVVTGNALLRAEEAVVDRFVTELVTRAPDGCEWIAAYDASAPMRPSMGTRGCLERISPSGSSFFPRARFMCQNAYPAEVERAIAGHNGISRLFRGRFVPSFAHLVLV